MKPVRQKLVLVEPVCRGSRLQWVWWLTEIAQDDYDVIIISREDCETEHFAELMTGLRFELRKVPGDFGGEWFPRISTGDWRRYLEELARFDREQSVPYQLFFLAIDDYLAAFTALCWRRFSLRHAGRVLTLKYRVECLMVPLGEFRQWMVGFVLKTVAWCWDMEVLTLDERIKGMRVGRHSLQWVPDPWVGEFSPAKRSEGRRHYGYAEDDFVLLLIGKQDSRKGLPFMLKALPVALRTHPWLKVCVCGKIDTSLVEQFEAMLKEFGQARIRHHNDFIAEADLPLAYAMASVVSLPYDPSFTSSSGVLPRACASEVPVIASDHGLVGARVSEEKLGEVVGYGDTTGFVEALSSIHSGDRRAEFQNGCREFSESCSEDVYKLRVKEILDQGANGA